MFQKVSLEETAYSLFKYEIKEDFSFRENSFSLFRCINFNQILFETTYSLNLSENKFATICFDTCASRIEWRCIYRFLQKWEVNFLRYSLLYISNEFWKQLLDHLENILLLNSRNSMNCHKKSVLSAWILLLSITNFHQVSTEQISSVSSIRPQCRLVSLNYI